MRSLAEQHEFNLRRWAELLADPKLAAMPNKIETDRDGKIIVNPPVDGDHGDRQAEIGSQLTGSRPKGRAIIECGVSTSEGTKVPDVAWLSSKHPEVLKAFWPLSRPRRFASRFCLQTIRRKKYGKKRLCILRLAPAKCGFAIYKARCDFFRRLVIFRHQPCSRSFQR